ncbi:MAG TPA: PIN domain-containing protein [Terriglobales bacterium]|nr:PIN domain-containing protein [Terriglobales bacterium]
MSAKHFLDTNVLVYAFDRRNARKSEVAQELIAEGLADRRTVVSYQVIQEFVNVVLRGFRVALTRPDLESFLLSALVPMAAISSSPALMIEGLQIQAAHQFGWYDSLIIAAALQGDCEILYSEDFQHGQRFGDLVVHNPFL